MADTSRAKSDGHAKWTGIFPAALTMFNADGSLDEVATSAHIDSLVRLGAHGLVIAGTSGEFSVLDSFERIRLIELAVRTANGRVPVVAGTGHSSTAETVRLTQQAAGVGADGAIVILPYYLRPTLAEIMEHFRIVGKQSSIPVMVYNNPANSAAPALQARHLRELHAGGFAQAVKSTFPTVHEVHEAIAETGPDFRVFYGSFMAPLEAMAGGAHGWISGILNVATHDAVAMRSAVQSGDLDAARLAWSRILPIKLLYTRELLGPVSDLAIYQGILRLRGEAAGYCRRPLLDLTDQQLTKLASLLQSEGLLGAAGATVQA